MIDTHCHIDLYEDPLAIVKDCEANNIVTIGMTNLPSHFEIGYPHLLKFKKVRLALGMHPLYVTDDKKEFDLFVKNLSRTSYIGEIGLDFSTEGIETKIIQIKILEKILNEVKGKKKLLSLHSRKAEKEVFKMLIDHKIDAAIFHWYSGPLSLIDQIASAGYHFSINPSMIKSKSGQEIIKRIPINKMLTESDGPFIRISNRNIVPNDVGLVLEYLSGVWNNSRNGVEEIVQENFKALISKIR